MSQIFLSNSLKTFKIRIESETTQVHFNKKTFENMKFFSPTIILMDPNNLSNIYLENTIF